MECMASCIVICCGMLADCCQTTADPCHCVIVSFVNITVLFKIEKGRAGRSWGKLQCHRKLHNDHPGLLEMECSRGHMATGGCLRHVESYSCLTNSWVVKEGCHGI
jgi:hypothetical protein